MMRRGAAVLRVGIVIAVALVLANPLLGAGTDRRCRTDHTTSHVDHHSDRKDLP